MSFGKNTQRDRSEGTRVIRDWVGNAIHRLIKYGARTLCGRVLMPRIAVFVDADNVNEHGIRSVFEKIQEHWNPTYRRAYGHGLTSSADVFREYGILAVEVIPNSPGKNAADVALIIDAMSELNSCRVDAFCLLTGDGDFTRLAIAIREKGLPVLVFGGDSAPISLRRAGTEFHELHCESGSAAKPRTSSLQNGEKGRPKTPVVFKNRTEFVDFVRTLIHANGSTTVQQINREACKRDPNFSLRRYHAGSLKSLVGDIAGCDICPITDPSGAIKDYEVKLAVATSPDGERNRQTG